MTDKPATDRAARAALTAASSSYEQLSAAYDDLADRYNAAQLALADLRSPSGQAMPQDVPDGWATLLADDFDTPCAAGNFLTVYGPRGFGAYADGWVDTSKRGRYSTRNISAAASVLTAVMLPPAGIEPAQVASITLPKLGPLSAVIMEERTRFNLSAGFKTAHLQWPDSGKKYPDGELDWPEFEGQTTTSIGGFVHWQGGTKNTDQTPAHTSADPRQWHTYRREWEAAKYVRFYIDGRLVLEVLGSKVPGHPMHFSLQNETSLTTPPTATDRGLIETDWIRVLGKTPAS